MNQEMQDRYPKDVGILAYEFYFPMQYVDQTRLEEFDKVSKGKYTIGLGQSKMGFCLDYEDINSICLTAFNNLIEKYEINLNEIGRLDVGTETLIDKSKSVKSTLMSLFEENGANLDIEGIDNLNACFGGTSALFNAINWIESSYWDGRYAVAVMGDLAVYAKGNARPTGGAGAIALLIGPNASIKFERGLRSLHMTHVYDFYKPILDSEYPIVDGKLSIKYYLESLDKCYNLYKKKYSNKRHIPNDKNNNSETFKSNDNLFDASKANAFIFHSPYCKLVQKSFSRLIWNDYLENSEYLNQDSFKSLEKFRNLSIEDTYINKELETELLKTCENLYKTKTLPSTLFSNSVGNMYTSSLYGGLASYLINTSRDNLIDSRVILFSYGSGAMSAMFSAIICDNSNENKRFPLDKLLKNLSQAKVNLNQRIEIEPVLFDKYLFHREIFNKKVPREPRICLDALYPGTWYLTSIDENYRRKYARKSTTGEFNCNIGSQKLKELLSDIGN